MVGNKVPSTLPPLLDAELQLTEGREPAGDSGCQHLLQVARKRLATVPGGHKLQPGSHAAAVPATRSHLSRIQHNIKGSETTVQSKPITPTGLAVVSNRLQKSSTNITAVVVFQHSTISLLCGKEIPLVLLS